jgi:type IV pilus assembly protein PilC
MPLFSYKAMDPGGRLVTGTLDARNLDELDRRLQHMELELTRSREINPNRWFGRGRITRKDLINFSVHMEQLLRAGISVMEGLEDIRNSTVNPMFSGVIASVLADIEGGKSLSQALATHPEAFDTVFVSLVRAGEESGHLDEVFHNIAKALKWQDEIFAQTLRAIMYPSFVLVVVLGVVSFMMIYLVPRLISFITGIGQELPLHTRMLIATSNAFVDYWYLIIGLPILAIVIYKAYYRVSPLFRILADRLKLRLWVAGPILEKIALARLANYFALTYRAGLGVMECIELCEDVVGNAYIRQGLIDARHRLSEGESISGAFEKTGLFPLLVIRMIRVGETTGALDESLMNVSYFYERDVRESIDRMQTMIEPALTVVLGLILGWVMLAVLGPIYDNISKLMV